MSVGMELEIRVLSAQGLNLINYSSRCSSLFMSNPIRSPFLTLTMHPPSHNHPKVFSSRLDDPGGGGGGGGGGGCFRVPLDSTFFSMYTHSSLHLELYSKRRVMGVFRLGWCVIPATDIGLLPPGSIRHLSYRLRGRDGSRGPAIINLSLQLKVPAPTSTAIGIPLHRMAMKT